MSEQRQPPTDRPDPSKTGHRSGQEYEYGETPETGLGGGGVGADPSKQNARHSTDSPAQQAGEIAGGSTQQVGGSSENAGFARDREAHAQLDDDNPSAKASRRSQHDDPHESRQDVTGAHGVSEEKVFDR
ncbi:MAG TPA: hypothetical protein VEC57_04740 [Candidatus Limnocylindrales bacterium]|nr:hypothetical protein [Candidatus Limnocylindrales bacterium]